MDQELYTNLLCGAAYCQKVEEYNKRIVEENGKKSNAENTYAARKAKCTPKAAIATLAIGIFILGLWGINLFLGLSSGRNGDLLVILQEDIAVLWLPIALIVASPILFVRYLQKKKALEEFKLQVEAFTAERNQAIAEIIKERDAYIERNPHVLNFLPSAFRDPVAVAYMFTYVSQGRADTLKEAMNLYEEQLHRWKLEGAARRAAEAQEYIAYAMDELNDQQAETNDLLRKIEDNQRNR